MFKKIFSKIKQFKNRRKFTGTNAVFDATNKEIPVNYGEEIDNRVSVRTEIIYLDRYATLRVKKGQSEPKRKDPDFEYEVDVDEDNDIDVD